MYARSGKAGYSIAPKRLEGKEKKKPPCLHFSFVKQDSQG
jgi:hypothetical protein